MAIAAVYPTFAYKGWVGSTPVHQPKCKCCAADISEELMELLVKRAAGQTKHQGYNLSLRGLVEYFAFTNRPFSKQALMNHMQKHVAVARAGQAAVAPSVKTGAKNVGVINAQKEQAIRARVAELPQATADDFRGPHVSYLEDVVRIAAEVVREFPERVTPEMGIRASAEIAKMRQNDSRDALLDMLVQTAVASPSKVGRVGQAAIVRELDIGEVHDAELVHESET